MPRTSSRAKIGKREIELSNLEKVLFPDDHIIKAQLIEYYLKVAPTILKHIKGRLLSLVRFPDGIYGESFFQKNLPQWAPSWIERGSLREFGGDDIDYALAGEEAALVWLANLACIELHQIQCRQPHLDKPDYVVFDLDPPPDYPFPDVVSLAFELKDHIEGYGYHTFVKTTGGKGVHIVCPIEPKWGYDEIGKALGEIAKPFVEKHPNSTTLQIKKDARRGRVFVDIFRNRRSQTIISPYSVRARAGAPVSMPLRWDELLPVESPLIFNINTVPDQLTREGDAWETIGAYAVKLHTVRKADPPKRASSKAAAQPKESDSGDTLTDYARKRSFSKTPEPGPEIAVGEGNAFVVHRHHASRLHYDLRLETGGALKSYAVPKGLPPRPGIKRLAVNTEDHPLSYADFEGTIPKGQYGGGNMWKFARGKYEILKQKKDGFYFGLQSRQITAEYRLIHTKEKEWLLERLDQPQVDLLRSPVEPMLAEIRDEAFDSEDYLYEVKWDGIRALISLDEGEITIRSRSQRNITKHFPELLIPDQAFRASNALFDAEIVCFNDDGKPNFEWSVRRIQQSGDSGIARLQAKHPALCLVFDCLYLDGRSIMGEPLVRRKEWLADSIRDNTPYRVSETMDEGVSLFEAVSKLGLEGIMAKERNSVYLPGRRSPSWLKIKSHRAMEAIIVGYTKGKGDRDGVFGALHLGCLNGKQIEYLGKVGTGFDDKLLRSIMTELARLKQVPRPFKERPLDDAQSVWIDPVIVCEVRYSSLTKDGRLREPVFLRLRPDMTPEDCERKSQQT